MFEIRAAILTVVEDHLQMSEPVTGLRHLGRSLIITASQFIKVIARYIRVAVVKTTASKVFFCLEFRRDKVVPLIHNALFSDRLAAYHVAVQRGYQVYIR